MNKQLKALVSADDQRVGDVEAELQQCEQRAAALQTMVTKLEDSNKVLAQEGQRDSKQETALDSQVDVLRKQYGEEEALREKAEAQTAEAAKLRDEVADLRDDAAKSAAAAAAANLTLAKSEVSAAHAREAETLATRRAGEIGEELFALRGKYKDAQEELRKAEDEKTSEAKAVVKARQDADEARKEAAVAVEAQRELKKERAEEGKAPPAPAKAGLLSRQRRHLRHPHAAHVHAHAQRRPAAGAHALHALVSRAAASRRVSAAPAVEKAAPKKQAPAPAAAPAAPVAPAAVAAPAAPVAPAAVAAPAAPAAVAAPASVPAAAPAAVAAVDDEDEADVDSLVAMD